MYPVDGTRHGIVTSMCFTTRHDYGLDVIETDDTSLAISMSGMNRQQQEALYRQMDQLYDHHISPLVRTLTEILGNTKDEELKQRIQLAFRESGGG